MHPKTAIYPGSFDPFTCGHLSLVERALKVFDKLIVALAVNVKKTPLFTVEERIQLIREACPQGDIEVVAFEGLLVDYAKSREVSIVLRGLRAMSDFEFEFQLAHLNCHLAPHIETVFMMTSQESFYISSQSVREVAAFGGKVDGLVPPNVALKLRERFRPQSF
ncbi:MAG: pantetheine-phosphate adenylyltransferase [Proteobacteria bacterium]|nr:pantetheine-phosphate adenylyltransferase [Cystobacterineae bacterium]MCL2258525.1 pantetheine-phosphate adenylyltransferase [Cystobacterineae bacterium]MCL2315247.1 pantetheine-phosphate adenylyltransferase [Pseudomonadota bacterium]